MPGTRHESVKNKLVAHAGIPAKTAPELVFHIVPSRAFTLSVKDRCRGIGYAGPPGSKVHENCFAILAGFSATPWSWYNFTLCILI